MHKAKRLKTLVSTAAYVKNSNKERTRMTSKKSKTKQKTGTDRTWMMKPVPFSIFGREKLHPDLNPILDSGADTTISDMNTISVFSNKIGIAMKLEPRRNNYVIVDDDVFGILIMIDYCWSFTHF